MVGMAEERAKGSDQAEELAKALEALASPVRLSLLHRLGRPAFMPALVDEFGITRQALKKHLDALEGVGLVVAKSSRRGALPATEYCTNPAGLFAFKERVRELAVWTDASALPPVETFTIRATGPGPSKGAGAGDGLLLVHGDAPGRWFTLAASESAVVGRDARADVPLVYDGFTSARHALLRRGPEGWTVTDLESTNGTRVNFRPVPPGRAALLRPGDLLTIGRSHLLLRDGG